MPTTNPIKITRLAGFGRGKTESFEESRITLGTAATCHFRFDPAWDKTVSAQHATLSMQPDGLWLEDQSTDGCWIDGRKVSRQRLQPGVTVSMGKDGPKIRIDFEPPPHIVSAADRPTVAIAGIATSGHPVVHNPASSPPVIPSPAPSAMPQRTDGRRPEKVPVFAWVAIGLIVLGLMAGAGILLLRRGNTDDQMAQVAKQYEDAVGIVVLAGQKNGESVSFPIATAWAIGDSVFASNSHVAEPVAQTLAKGASAFIILNRNPEKKFRITKAVVHPKYNQHILNIEGKEPGVPVFDVGLLYVEGRVPKKFKLAPATELHQLDSGYRVAYLGFPMENLAGHGTDFRNPVATMQSGILTSVTDYWMAKAPHEQALLLQHSLGATGGASGSPIFNANGEVVGILSAGNIIGQIGSGGERQRAPSAVMINFAQRIDILSDIYPDYTK